jgi:hypothetical protein
MKSPARAWREQPQRYRLEAARNPSTGKLFYPPRPVHPSFDGVEAETVTLPREGTVLTFTVIHVPPTGFEAPLVIALVELVNGVRLMVQVADVADTSEVAIGMPVELQFRRIQPDGEAGVLLYGHKAVPKR